MYSTTCEVIGYFQLTYFFKPHYGPGIDSASNRNQLETDRKQALHNVIANETELIIITNVRTSNSTWHYDPIDTIFIIQTNKLRGLGPRANYTDRATAACLRS
jgi:hypothetical protein